MRIVLISIFIAGCFTATAQPKILDHAYIITKAKLKFADTPENTNNNPFSTLGGSTTHLHSINGMTEGDNRIITYYKQDKIKVINDINMGTNTIIIDKKNKKTITLVDVMGVKTGFYTSEESAKQMQALADSINKSRHPDSISKSVNGPSKKITKDSLKANIIYSDDNKTIAGFNCKMAKIISTHYNGEIDSINVWYCPEFKFKRGFNIPIEVTGVVGMAPFDLLEGFPMKYETTDRRGNKFSVEVKKIDINKEIKDKEFDVPNSYDLKPMTYTLIKQQAK